MIEYKYLKFNGKNYYLNNNIFSGIATHINNDLNIKNILYINNGKLHRLDGPAIEYSNNQKDFYKNGKRHRETGPARILSSCENLYFYYNGCLLQYYTTNNNDQWWYDGKRIHCKNYSDFKSQTILRAFQ